MSTANPDQTILDRAATWHPAVIIAAAAGGALVVNLVLWLIGAAAGGSFELTEAGERSDSAPGGVVVMTVIPLVVGLTLATVIALKWRGVIRIAQVIGAVAAVGSIAAPIIEPFDGASTVALSLMHIVLAPVVVIALEAIGRRLA